MSPALVSRIEHPPGNSLAFAFAGVWAFFLMYYIRPNEWLPGVGSFEFAKLAAFFAIAGCLAVLPFKGGEVIRPIRQSGELKGFILLYGFMWFTVPTATWPGGSFRLLAGEYWKVIVITLIIGVTVTSLSRLKKLVWVSVVSMSVLAALAVHSFSVGDLSFGRVRGAFQGLFGNPNELAFNLTVLLPFCFVFGLTARTILFRLSWAVCAVTMILGVLVTFSRSGFLSLLACTLVLVWELGFKGRRPSVVLFSVLLAGVLAGAFLPTGYEARMETILDPSLDKTGSAQERQLLFQRSVSLLLERPLLGVGPGNFAERSGRWKEPHNTFLQLGTEAGIPALLLFLWILRRAFLGIARTIRDTEHNSKVQLLAQASRASLVALVTGCLFADMAYHFYAYFPIAYSVVIARIAQQDRTAPGRETFLRPEASMAGMR